MKAAVRKQYGGPEVLEIINFEKPAPAQDQVLIKVHCTTINRTDCGVLTGLPYFFRLFIGVPRPKLPITGTDFAGEVVEVGLAVTKFKIGDRVFGLNDEGLSSHAEYLAIGQDKAIAKIPDGVDYATAAASAEGAHYARNFLNKISLKPGDRVLVNGATGAIGSASIQFLKLMGVHITAVCDTKNFDLISQQGVDEVINYEEEDFTKRDAKFRLVLDSVGKSRYKYCRRILQSDGQYSSSELGPRWENIFLALWSKISGSKKVIFPVPTDCRKSIVEMSGLLARSEFHPLIDRIYPLGDIQEAFKYVLTGMKTGNVILKIVE